MIAIIAYTIAVIVFFWWGRAVRGSKQGVLIIDLKWRSAPLRVGKSRSFGVPQYDYTFV